jgi:hypothetical protein
MRTGGCQCGAVRFKATEPKFKTYACHCSQCQKQSASAFGLSVPVARERFSVEGPTSYWSRSTFSGGRTDCHFCMECGTRVYHSNSRGSYVTVKGGAFDNVSDLEPQAHLWTSMKLPWTVIPPDVEQYETQPPDLRAWRQAFLAS